MIINSEGLAMGRRTPYDKIMPSEPPRGPNPLQSFLRPYEAAPFSDRARLWLFVVTQLVLLALAAVLLMGGGWGAPVTVPFLVVEVVFFSSLLLLVRQGYRNWAEGLSALTLPLVFLYAVATDPKVLADDLGLDLLLAYGQFCLILITMTTSGSRWILIAGTVLLAGGLWFRMGLQLPLEGRDWSAQASSPPTLRFVLVDLLAMGFLTSIQRVIRRANRLAEAVVSSQARDLEAALDQVRSAQKALSEGDKLSTVGRFAAGIAHEINTPLGAIHSSASHLGRRLESLIETVLGPEVPWTATERRQLTEMVSAADLSGLQTSSTLRRRGVRELRARTEEMAPDLPAEVVDLLADWGLFQPRPEWLALLTGPRGTQATQLVSGVVEMNRSAGIISVASGKASNYVQELRKFITKDRSAQPVRPVSVVDSLETFLLLFQNQLKGRIEVTKAYPEAECRVMGQPDRLLQIWSNLISNAVAAMGESGRLALTVRSRAGQVEVSIADDGPGISDAIRPRIFEPFFSTKQPGEGMGLGLEIVRTIVDEHGGTIALESKPGQTVFTVSLPLAEDLT